MALVLRVSYLSLLSSGTVVIQCLALCLCLMLLYVKDRLLNHLPWDILLISHFCSAGDGGQGLCLLGEHPTIELYRPPFTLTYVWFSSGPLGECLVQKFYSCMVEEAN